MGRHMAATVPGGEPRRPARRDRRAEVTAPNTMEALRYAGGHLDRADRLRKDPDGLAARLARPDTRVVPVWRDRSLIAGLDDHPPAAAAGEPATVAAVALAGGAAARVVEASAETVFLGLDGGTAVFAADLSDLAEDEAAGLARLGSFVDLRRAGPLMEAREASMAAYARGILHWHRNHRHCGRCGTASESRDGGHMRLCGDPGLGIPGCGQRTFPCTDPAVIMLVETGPADGAPARCLLGRHRRLPPGVYSTLAGFVEPGESLEEAVAREVREETGVHVAAFAASASRRSAAGWG